MNSRSPLLRWGVIAAALLVAGGAAITLFNVLRPTTEFSARFPSAVGLYVGSDVQVLGVPVGKVTAVEPQGAEVIVRMELDHGRKVAADTGAAIVAPTLVSDRYVQLTKAYSGGRSLRGGTMIKQTAVPVEIDQLYTSLVDIGTQLGPDGANKDGALSTLLTTVARNLDGQGTDINRAVSGFSQASATVAGFDKDLFATVRNLDTLNTTLLEKDSSVANANQRLAEVAQVLGDDRENLARALEELGGAMSSLEGFIKDNRAGLKNSIEGLRGPTQVLVDQRKALSETIRTLPVVLQNFLNAYDVNSGTIQGRGNLNELTLGGGPADSARTPAPATSNRSSAGTASAPGTTPPLLLPSVGDPVIVGGQR